MSDGIDFQQTDQTDGIDFQTSETSTPPAGFVLDQPTIPQSLGHAFVNNLPMGGNIAAGAESIPGVGTGKDYHRNLKEWNAQTDIDKSAHPVAYGAGAVAGAAAPLAIPGVGELAEGAPIATNAIWGALGSAGNTDLTKHPMEALKEAGVGAGVGGLTAGVLGKVLPSEKGLENIASKKAIQSIEIPPGIVGAMEPEERSALGKFIQQNGLVGRDKPAILEQARELSRQFGEKIGEIAKKSGEEGLSVDPADHYKAIQGLLDKAEQYKGLSNREARLLARDYTAGANDVLNMPDHPTWADIQKLKDQYGKLAFNAKGEVKSEGTKDTYFALKDLLTGIAQKAQDSNLAPEYKEALLGYSRMQPIESGLEKAVDAELRGTGSGMGVRGITGLVKKLPGPIRAIIGPAALATGHPFIAGLSALPELTNSALQSKAAAGLSKVMPSFRQGITQEISDYVNSKRKTPQ